LLGVHLRYGLHTRAVTVYRDTLSEGFSHFVTSMTAPVASGWSGCRVGLAPTGKRRLVTAHAISRLFAIDGIPNCACHQAPIPALLLRGWEPNDAATLWELQIASDAMSLDA
jgi:hypothetical protein